MRDNQLLRAAIKRIGTQTDFADALNALEDKPARCKKVRVNQKNVTGWLANGLPDHWVLPVSKVTRIPPYKLSDLYPKGLKVRA